MSVEVTTLKSGITVVTDTMPHLETASLGVWVAAGSRDERINEHGISHFLEHMAFKGTRRRSARQIAEEIDAVGGDINAATGLETTAYYARMLKADMPLAFDVLADILAEPIFASEDVALEQSVIIQEIGAVADNPDDLVFEHLSAIAFPNQPFGRPILGTTQTVRSFNGGSLRDYLDRHYHASDMVVAAAGAVDHAAVVTIVENRFASFAGPASPTPEPAKFVGGNHIERRDLEQVHIAMALPGVALTDPTVQSLEAFANVLGGGMSSRLFQEAREQRGLCYSISAFHVPYSDTGMFGLYSGTDAADTEELMRVIVGEIAAAAENVSEFEIARAKAQMKAGLLMALESSGARASRLANSIIMRGRHMPVEETVEKIDAITVDSARAAGRALIARGKMATAVLGPGSGLESAAAIAETLTRRAA
jgi:predicted Zn-dependent peptidase